MFGMVGGLLADRYPKRKILLLTQLGMATVAGTLACLTLAGWVAAWHVYVLAFALGIVTAVDNPTRQSFANEMVGPDQLRNAISINSSVFQLGGLVGPAISGMLIGAVGPGYLFALNALSYVAPFIALSRMRDSELTVMPKVVARPGQLRDALRYARGRPEVLWPTVLVGVFGMFTANLPVTLAAYARSVFHSGPSGYGWLNATVAVGSLTGALISARRARTTLRTLVIVGAVLASVEMIAAAVPSEIGFRILLLVIGATTLMLLTSANATVQTAAPDEIRGRVMGMYLLVFIGSAAIGGPLLGATDEHLGPRIGMLLAGAVPAVATVFVGAKVARITPNAVPAPMRSLRPPSVEMSADGRCERRPVYTCPIVAGTVGCAMSRPDGQWAARRTSAASCCQSAAGGHVRVSIAVPCRAPRCRLTRAETPATWRRAAYCSPSWRSGSYAAVNMTAAGRSRRSSASSGDTRASRADRRSAR